MRGHQLLEKYHKNMKNQTSEDSSKKDRQSKNTVRAKKEDMESNVRRDVRDDEYDEIEESESPTHKVMNFADLEVVTGYTEEDKKEAKQAAIDLTQEAEMEVEDGMDGGNADSGTKSASATASTGECNQSERATPLPPHAPPAYADLGVYNSSVPPPHVPWKYNGSSLDSGEIPQIPGNAPFPSPTPSRTATSYFTPPLSPLGGVGALPVPNTHAPRFRGSSSFLAGDGEIAITTALRED